MLPIRVDCHGAKGKYVRVQLPGKKRLFYAHSIQARPRIPYHIGCHYCRCTFSLSKYHATDDLVGNVNGSNIRHECY